MHSTRIRLIRLLIVAFAAIGAATSLVGNRNDQPTVAQAGRIMVLVALGLYLVSYFIPMKRD